MIIMLRRIRTPLLALAATLVACGEPTSPETEGADQIGTYEPPIEFQEGDLVVGGVVYTGGERCGWRYDELSPADPVIVDLVFRGLPLAQPRPQNAQTVRDVGGEVVREFNTAVVRARLPRSSLPEIANHPHPPNFARAVVRHDRFDVLVSIGPKSEVRARFEELGGVITSESHSHEILRGAISDDSIPALRKLGEEMTWLDLGGRICVTDQWNPE